MYFNDIIIVVYEPIRPLREYSTIFEYILIIVTYFQRMCLPSPSDRTHLSVRYIHIEHVYPSVCLFRQLWVLQCKSMYNHVFKWYLHVFHLCFHVHWWYINVFQGISICFIVFQWNSIHIKGTILYFNGILMVFQQISTYLNDTCTHFNDI
jgi:hypothetical protein